MAEPAELPETRARDNRRTLTRLSIMAAAMFGFGFAMVPFYERICQALGVNSLVERSDAPANTQVDRTRTPSLDTVFLLGLSEGQFPKVAREDSVLSDGERRSRNLWKRSE